MSHHPSRTQTITPPAQIMLQASLDTPSSPGPQCQPRTSRYASQPSVLWEQSGSNVQGQNQCGSPKNLAEKTPTWAGVLLSLKPKPHPWPPPPKSPVSSSPLPSLSGLGHLGLLSAPGATRSLLPPGPCCLHLCLGSPAPPFRLSLSRTFCDQPRH